ncbi:hypothetical protein WS68_04895 [Burkholderia sp. TSV86]|nr:hypothetical protein WS68_04895 [Burkholderia sp. TSV86]
MPLARLANQRRSCDAYDLACRRRGPLCDGGMHGRWLARLPRPTRRHGERAAMRQAFGESKLGAPANGT